MLTITQDTILKPLPKQASDLPWNQIIAIQDGKTIEFDRYTKEDGHICFDETLYVFEGHVKREGDAITATQDTWLKPSRAQAADTKPESLIELPKGKTILCYKGCDREGGHYRVKVELCVYGGHARVEETAAIALAAQPVSKKLTDADFERVANAIGCHVAAVRAVVAIESAGSGFLADGRPKILFEAHHFSRLTGRRFDGTHPSISSKRWNRRLYKGGSAEWNRLDQAVQLDRTAALRSASWGLGQVMGFNHKIVDHDSVQSFVNANFRSEGDQLDIMFAFIKNNRLDRHLRSLDFTSFARGYNGSGFAVHGYHTKLANAYRKFAKK